VYVRSSNAFWLCAELVKKTPIPKPRVSDASGIAAAFKYLFIDNLQELSETGYIF
jgi:hypothetical protein